MTVDNFKQHFIPIAMTSTIEVKGGSCFMDLVVVIVCLVSGAMRATFSVCYPKNGKVQKKFTFQGFLQVSGTVPTALWCTGSIPFINFSFNCMACLPVKVHRHPSGGFSKIQIVKIQWSRIQIVKLLI
jgi:hypothetical protein